MAETLEDLIAELEQKNIKHTPDEIIWIGRDAQGKVVWLENGDSQKGLTHILTKRKGFAGRQVASEDIADLILAAVTKGNLIGYQGQEFPRLVFAVIFKGKHQFVAVSISTNGYIVGANPADPSRIRKISNG